MRLSTIHWAARSRSASFITMAGALPPNSSDTLVIFFEAAAMMLSPAPTEPVTLTISIFGEPAISLPITLPLPVTILMTPAGSPISSIILANSVQFSGVSCEGLMTMVQPAINAAPALRAMRKNGKFQGRMPATTPIGFLVSRMVSLGRSLGIISPSIWRAKVAIYSK